MATKFVRANGGDDGNDGSTFALAWATPAYAFDAGNGNRVAPGEELRVCGDDTYFYDLAASFSPACASAPSATAPVYINAGDMSTGALRTDGSRVKITTTATLANGLLYFSDTTNARNFYWNNFDFDGGGVGKGEYCISSASSDDFETMKFFNCLMHNADADGVYFRCPGSFRDAIRIYGCDIYDNGKGGSGWGINTPNNSRPAIILINSKIHDNPSGGARVGSLAYLSKNVVYDNAGPGVYLYANSIGDVIDGNVIDGNDGNGLELQSGSLLSCCTNNSFTNNGGYGIDYDSVDVDSAMVAVIKNNCYYNNTSGHIDINGGTPFGDGNVTSDPKYVSRTDGSEDFTLQSDSPCKNAGYGYNG